MLYQLSIKNFAIIDDLTVNFQEGFNVITGETGAGKSIIINAISIILGEKINKNHIKDNNYGAYFEAIFQIKEYELSEFLRDRYDIDSSQEALVISREINLKGSSVSRINGRAISISELKDVAYKLVDIYGQHDHQLLLNTKNHIQLLDSFGDANFLELKNEFSIKFKEHAKLKKTLKLYENENTDNIKQKDFLEFQIKEIESADLKKNEDIELEKELKNILNYSRLLNCVENEIDIIDNETSGLNTTLNRALSIIKEMSEIDSSVVPLFKRIESISFEITDIRSEIWDYKTALFFDEERVYFVKERLNVINNLKMKYGNSMEDILSYKNELISKLNRIDDNKKIIEELQSQTLYFEEILEEQSNKIRSLRKSMAEKVKGSLLGELISLNMNNCDFEIVFSEKEITEQGKDGVEFLISTNLNQPLRNLSMIASGGEMSRIMLAFKNISAYMESVPTLIFDEIDSGISGVTAHAVAKKIKNIAKKHQVICISHLPQVTSLADNHYLIEKFIAFNQVSTNMRLLDKKERILEIARLLGGVNITENTLNSAEEMIEAGKLLNNLEV